MHPLNQFLYCPKCGSKSFEINNEKSKHCPDCGFIYYFNPVAANVAIIINDNKELLVAKRAKEPAKGTLDLPGGFADSFETGEEGVTREVREETGLIVNSIRYLFSLPNTYPYCKFEVHTLDLFFLCKTNNCDNITALDDVESLQWIPISALEPQKFGLDSIRKGIEIFKNLYLSKQINTI